MKRDEISPKDFARHRGWTLKYVYDLLAVGRIRGAKKVGKRWTIPAAVLKASGDGEDVNQDRLG